MRSYKDIEFEEKEKIYSLARAGVSDDALCVKFCINEAMLLMIFDEVHVKLQNRRGYKGIFTYKSFFRGDM